MEIIKLKEVVKEINSGYHLRSKISDANGTDACLLRAFDILHNDGHVLREVDINKCGIKNLGVSHKHLVNNGDILLTARSTVGGHFKSTYVDIDRQNKRLFNDSADIPVYAGLSLFIIRVDKDKILPEYLVLYLNAPEGQKQLRKISEGVTVSAISKSRLLDEIEIPILDAKLQKIIVNYARAAEEEKKLLKQKIELQNQILKTLPTLIK